MARINMLDGNELIEQFEMYKSTIGDHENGDHGDPQGTENFDQADDECPRCYPNDEPGDRFQALTDLDDEIGLEYLRDEGPAVDEGDFEDYAMELAEDLGLMEDANRWPFTCVDWEQAAKELAYDYSSFDFEGTTWLYRS